MSEHRKKYEKIAQTLGVNDLIKMVPAQRRELELAYAANKHMNTIPLDAWDRQHDTVRNMSMFAGIMSWSMADTVCTLKHVAIVHVLKKEQEELK